MVILIPVFFLLCFVIQLLTLEKMPRKAGVQGILFFFFFAAVTTEILSLFNGLHILGLTLVWILLDVVLLAAVIFLLANKEERSFQLQSARDFITDLTRGEIFMVGVIVFFLLVTGLIALLSPPNNVDSMVYHMARVAHWIQNQNVRFYPTWVERQNHAMPLAEYGILHLQILSRSDRFANLIQWSAYLGSIILSSLMAREFKLSRRYQLLAGFLVAVLPMAILQSTSTQNDLVVSFFVLAFGYYLIRFGDRKKLQPHLFAALALGLALLTKGTAYIYTAAVGLVFGVGQLKEVYRRDRSKLIQHGFRLVVIVILALALNLGHFSRNMSFYGHPLSTANDRVTTDQISLPIIFANLIRNAAVQLATPVKNINQGLSRAINNILGPWAEHPQSTFGGQAFRLVFFMNEDYAGNPLHFLLLLISLGWSLFMIRGHNLRIIQYSISIITGIVLFSSLIKWQPWVSRLQLPLFIFGTPFIAYFWKRFSFPKNRHNLLLAAVAVLGFPYLFFNSMRPMVPFLRTNPLESVKPIKQRITNSPQIFDTISSYLSPFYAGQSIFLSDRDRLYFMGIQDYYWPFYHAVQEIKIYQPETVGLYFREGPPWEYPLWKLTEQYYHEASPVFLHVGMKSDTSELKHHLLEWPEIVVTTDPDPVMLYQDPNLIEIYQHQSGKIRVFNRQEIQSEPGLE